VLASCAHPRPNAPRARRPPDLAHVTFPIASARPDMATLTIAKDGGSGVVLNIFCASAPAAGISPAPAPAKGMLPTFPPIADISKLHAFVTALRAPPPPTSQAPTPQPPPNRASLLVNERTHLRTPIGKRADDQIVLMLPSGEEHVIAGQSHHDTVQTLQEWLMRAKIDLTHNAGAATEAVRAVVECLGDCLQLGVDDLGPIRHFRVSILDALGGRHAPPATPATRPPACGCRRRASARSTSAASARCLQRRRRPP